VCAELVENAIVRAAQMDGENGYACKVKNNKNKTK